jgi:soluble lytic murein transglycosylase-like protein
VISRIRRFGVGVAAGLPTIPIATLALSAAFAGERPSARAVETALARTAPAAQRPERRSAAEPAAETALPSADPVARWRRSIAEASRRFGVPAAWIEQVMRAESGGHPRLNGRPITSRAGAMGLMQLMPATWSAMRGALALGTDPYDPRDNILAGTAYLAALYRRFGYPGLFGAYNAGPGRYAAWLAGRAALPGETRDYLARMGAEAAPETLFAERNGRTAAPARTEPRRALASRRARLFAVDRTGGRATGRSPDERREGLFVALSSTASPPADN